MEFQIDHHRHIHQILNSLNIEPLKEAIVRFQNNADFRYKYYENLQISASFLPRLIDGIDLLAQKLDFSKTRCTISESGEEIFSIGSS